MSYMFIKQLVRFIEENNRLSKLVMTILLENSRAKTRYCLLLYFMGALLNKNKDVFIHLELLKLINAMQVEQFEGSPIIIKLIR